MLINMDNHKALNMLFQFISLFGTPIFYTPVIIYLGYINLNFTIKLIVIIILTEILGGAIKILYPKERPMPMKNKTIIQKYRAGSFPSIHSARITALSAGLATLYSNKLFIVIMILLVISVGYSRIYLKKHYAIDVIGGYIIGAIISIIGLNIWD